jgi:ABC-2 type transport system ATP-binding protein
VTRELATARADAAPGISPASPRLATGSNAMPSQISVRGLRKQYPKVLAVAGIDLEIGAGEVFGLLGPNGAGKTTTLEMIEGLTPPDAGEISICGLTWRRHGPEIRARIGVQLQATSLYNKITPREALDLFGSYYPKRRPTDELLELVQLRDKADTYHITLSGGQMQRLALALALVNDPEVVFLDEPTAGLDPQGRRSLWDVVRRMKAEGRTVMLTTHYMDEAEALCDRLAILDHGKVLRSGTPGELIASLGIPSVVELSFDGAAPDPADFAARLGAAVEARGDRWDVPTPDPKTLLPRLLAKLEEQRLAYDQVHIRRATLEDVFLHLTGRSLRD